MPEDTESSIPAPEPKQFMRLKLSGAAQGSGYQPLRATDLLLEDMDTGRILPVNDVRFTADAKDRSAVIVQFTTMLSEIDLEGVRGIATPSGRVAD